MAEKVNEPLRGLPEGVTGYAVYTYADSKLKSLDQKLNYAIAYIVSGFIGVRLAMCDGNLMPLEWAVYAAIFAYVIYASVRLGKLNTGIWRGVSSHTKREGDESPGYTAFSGAEGEDELAASQPDGAQERRCRPE